MNNNIYTIFVGSLLFAIVISLPIDNPVNSGNVAVADPANPSVQNAAPSARKRRNMPALMPPSSLNYWQYEVHLLWDSQGDIYCDVELIVETPYPWGPGCQASPTIGSCYDINNTLMRNALAGTPGGCGTNTYEIVQINDIYMDTYNFMVYLWDIGTNWADFQQLWGTTMEVVVFGSDATTGYVYILQDWDSLNINKTGTNPYHSTGRFWDVGSIFIDSRAGMFVRNWTITNENVVQCNPMWVTKGNKNCTSWENGSRNCGTPLCN